jgi:hypothetical protein
MDPKKVKSIVEWTILRKKFEVKIFHGLPSFYQKFIRNFSGICTPLTTCMRKGEFQWNAMAQKGFELLKKKTIRKLVLALTGFVQAFQVDYDVIETTIGAVLS